MVINTILPSTDQHTPSYQQAGYDAHYSVYTTTKYASYVVAFDTPGVYYLNEAVTRERIYRPPNSSSMNTTYGYSNYTNRQSIIVVTEPSRKVFSRSLPSASAYVQYIYNINVVVFSESGLASISENQQT